MRPLLTLLLLALAVPGSAQADPAARFDEILQLEAEALARRGDESKAEDQAKLKDQPWLHETRTELRRSSGLAARSAVGSSAGDASLAEALAGGLTNDSDGIGFGVSLGWGAFLEQAGVGPVPELLQGLKTTLRSDIGTAQTQIEAGWAIELLRPKYVNGTLTARDVVGDCGRSGKYDTEARVFEAELKALKAEFVELCGEVSTIPADGVEARARDELAFAKQHCGAAPITKHRVIAVIMDSVGQALEARGAALEATGELAAASELGAALERIQALEARLDALENPTPSAARPAAPAPEEPAASATEAGQRRAFADWLKGTGEPALAKFKKLRRPTQFSCLPVGEDLQTAYKKFEWKRPKFTVSMAASVTPSPLTAGLDGFDVDPSKDEPNGRPLARDGALAITLRVAGFSASYKGSWKETRPDHTTPWNWASVHTVDLTLALVPIDGKKPGDLATKTALLDAKGNPRNHLAIGASAQFEFAPDSAETIDVGHRQKAVVTPFIALNPSDDLKFKLGVPVRIERKATVGDEDKRGDVLTIPISFLAVMDW